MVHGEGNLRYVLYYIIGVKMSIAAGIHTRLSVCLPRKSMVSKWKNKQEREDWTTVAKNTQFSRIRKFNFTLVLLINVL